MSIRIVRSLCLGLVVGAGLFVGAGSIASADHNHHRNNCAPPVRHQSHYNNYRNYSYRAPVIVNPGFGYNGYSSYYGGYNNFNNFNSYNNGWGGYGVNSFPMNGSFGGGAFPNGGAYGMGGRGFSLYIGR